MEEVLPSSVADAEALAPEEIYAKKRGREAEFLEGDSVYLVCRVSPYAIVCRYLLFFTFNSNEAACPNLVGAMLVKFVTTHSLGKIADPS